MRSSRRCDVVLQLIAILDIGGIADDCRSAVEGPENLNRGPDRVGLIPDVVPKVLEPDFVYNAGRHDGGVGDLQSVRYRFRVVSARYEIEGSDPRAGNIHVH